MFSVAMVITCHRFNGVEKHVYFSFDSISTVIKLYNFEKNPAYMKQGHGGSKHIWSPHL